MDKKAIMDSLAREAFEKAGFAGAWLYAERGEIVSKGAVGINGAAGTEPIREDMVFDLASVSKQFTATAVMLLRRDGLLSLADEITKFFPEIPYRGVTIRHLLNHTGGLPDYIDWFDAFWKKEGRIPNNATIVRFLCECGEPAVFAPGEKWEYSNTGYCLLAQIVEEVSGLPFENFLRDRLFEPAGMHKTRVYHRRMDALTIPDLAWGLMLPFGSDQYALPDEREEESEVLSCDGVSGDGLVHSNVFDLLAWDRALREGKILTEEEQALMFTPARLNNGEIAETDEESEDGYGFGWGIERDPQLGLVVKHSGGWPGYSAWYERFIDADRVLILLCCRDARDGKAYDAFFEGLRAVARGKEPAPVRTLEELAVREPDKSGWERFCGKYDYSCEDIFKIDEIYRKDGALYANMSYKGTGCAFRLYPLEDGSFGMKPYIGTIRFGDGTLSLWGENGKKLKE